MNLLTDNAKTAATAHIANVAVINVAMVKFSAAYGFTLRTCIPYDPASKGGVERAVRVAKEHLCSRETNLVARYESTAALKEAIDAYNREINAEVRSGSGALPELVLKKEQAAFSRLPKTPYVGAYGVERRVEAKMPIVRFAEMRLLGAPGDARIGRSCAPGRRRGGDRGRGTRGARSRSPATGEASPTGT